MHRAHQGTRHLLPPITSDPDETVVAEKRSPEASHRLTL